MNKAENKAALVYIISVHPETSKLTVKRIAELLDVTRQTAHNYIKELTIDNFICRNARGFLRVAPKRLCNDSQWILIQQAIACGKVLAENRKSQIVQQYKLWEFLS